MAQQDTQQPPDGFYPDPGGQFQQRQWRAGAWTDVVRHHGHELVAPLPPWPAQPHTSAMPSGVGTTAGPAVHGRVSERLRRLDDAVLPSRRRPRRGAVSGVLSAMGTVFLLIMVVGLLDSGTPDDTTSTATPAPRPVRSLKPVTVLGLKGSGSKSTAAFTVPDTWALAWAYDCSGFGMSGNFIVDAVGDTPVLPVNQLGMKDVGHEIYHEGGTFHLEVNSECAWRVRVVAAR